MVNSWVEHVRKYAKDHSLSYMCAATDPKCRMEYKKGKPLKAQRNPAPRRARTRAASPMFGMSPEMVRSAEEREFYPVINFDGMNAFYQSSLF